MKVLAIAQVEDPEPIIAEIEKQTIQPDLIRLHIDTEPAYDKDYLENIRKRRERIAENHAYLRDIVEEVQPDYVWQVEQDSVLPEDTLERLLTTYHHLELEDIDVGYISGVQVGRHGIYCIGAWHIGKDEFSSLDYKKNGLQQVDATGFYCLLAPKDIWLEGRVSWNGEPYGPDVNFGLSLREKKYTIYVDTDLHIGHRTSTGIIEVSDRTTCNVHFKKKGTIWRYQTSR